MPTPSATAIMSAAALRAVRPRERLTVSQWADNHRILTSKQSGETGRWRTSRNPMLREIMDALSAHSPVKEVVIMKSSQVGVTEGPFICWLGYIIDHAPGPAMVLMPTLEARDTWRVQKLNPLFTDTPAVRDIIGGLRSRDAANSKDMVDFPGGIVFLAGGNSPNSYAQKSVRYLMMDDLDRFTANVGDEGDPVGLARGRVKAFPRHKILFASTPTIKGASLIEREYEATDRRRYWVPCPHCHEYQVLNWKNVVGNATLTEAHYACEHCGALIHEHHKPAMLANGQWRAEFPENERRGYHISALYAPIGLGPSWLDLLREFKAVFRDPSQLKPFINGHLGESWEDQTDKLKPNELAKRASEYQQGNIPPGCLALTCGVDTQDGWLSVKVLGWGANGRHWIIETADLQGDTTQRAVWDELESFVHRAWVNSYGHSLKLRATGIDSRGHRSKEVRDFVERSTLRVPVYAIQGATTRMARAIAQTASHPEKNHRGKLVKRGYALWNVGTEYCKDFIYGNLAADGQKQPDERVFSFPEGLPDEYYDGLLSETYDPEKRRYIKRLGKRYNRNEPLDTLVYAWAIGQHRDINIGRFRNGKPDAQYWKRLADMLEQQAAAPASETKPAEVAPKAAQDGFVKRRPRRGGFVGSW